MDCVMRLGLAKMRLRAWVPLGIGFVSLSCTVTSQPAGANDEIAKLRADVEKLKAKIKGQEEAPPKGQELAFIKSRETLLDGRTKKEKEDATPQIERPRLELALSAAN